MKRVFIASVLSVGLPVACSDDDVVVSPAAPPMFETLDLPSDAATVKKIG